METAAPTSAWTRKARNGYDLALYNWKPQGNPDNRKSCLSLAARHLFFSSMNCHFPDCLILVAREYKTVPFCRCARHDELPPVGLLQLLFKSVRYHRSAFGLQLFHSVCLLQYLGSFLDQWLFDFAQGYYLVEYLVGKAHSSCIHLLEGLHSGLDMSFKLAMTPSMSRETTAKILQCVDIWGHDLVLYKTQPRETRFRRNSALG